MTRPKSPDNLISSVSKYALDTFRYLKDTARAQNLNEEYISQISELISKIYQSTSRMSNDYLLKSTEVLKRIDWNKVTRDIFDINEDSILNNSTASQGLIGKLNSYGRSRKNRNYYRKIYSGHRKKLGNKVIVAEGDSWFEYPIFIRDSIDWLASYDENAVFSDAYGADWLSNILHEDEYVESLPIHEPDAFLISGGGNDMVGGQRIASIINNAQEITVDTQLLKEVESIFEEYERDTDSLLEGTGVSNKMIIKELSQPYIKETFYTLLEVFRSQYFLLLNSINNAKANGKFTNMITLSQGYDYPIPTKNLFNGVYWWLPWNILAQGLTNYLMPNGIWIYRPMLTKGIYEPILQRAIIFSILDQFNEMLVSLTDIFPFHYHIDCRGLAPKEKNWYNELHPHSHQYKRVAKAIHLCIHDTNRSDKKIYKVTNLL